MTEEREKILLATQAAATFKPDYMTNDKLEAVILGFQENKAIFIISP